MANVQETCGNCRNVREIPGNPNIGLCGLGKGRGLGVRSLEADCSLPGSFIPTPAAQAEAESEAPSSVIFSSPSEGTE